MTDFISGLLDRALNRAPVLERRRPSRFEPTPIAGRLGFARLGYSPDREGEMTDSVSESDSLPKTVELQASPRPRISVPATRHTVSPSAESSSAEPVRLRNAQVTAPPLTTGLDRKAPAFSTAPSPPRIETVVLKEIQRHESFAVNSPASSSVTKAPAPRVITPSASEVPARPAPLIRSDPRPETRSRDDDVGTHRAELVPASSPRAAAPPVLVPPRPVQSLATSRAEVTRESEPAPPAIQITIGRIEVRATAPAAEPPRSTPRAALRLSLEDYLRSRGGRTS